MKNSYWFVIYFVLCGLSSCNLDIFPTSALTPEQLADDPGGAVYATDGNYSLFKDEFEYSGYASGNSYIRHYFQMSEYAGDNVTLSGRTTSAAYETACLCTYSSLKNVQSMWFFAYRIINGANAVIESVQDGASVESDYLKGENYFLRAICELHLATFYAKPYSFGRENPGIVLRTSTNTSETKRAAVGETYDQIVTDLQRAIELMHGKSRGNAGYASREAAQGLLSRVYLYREENQKVVDMVNEMLAGADPSGKLEPTATFPTYFANTLTSVETLWAVAHTALETKGQASVASMYLNDGIGWGEVYATDPLNNLYDRYPEDIRHQFILPQYADTSHMVACFPVTNLDDAGGRANYTFMVTVNTAGQWTFTDSEDGKTYVVQTKLVNGEYPEYYVNYGGEEIAVRVTKAMSQRNTYPKYYNIKFSYQDGDPMLNSPVMIRWAEVILNRAEAYAKLDRNAEALADVNVIRSRAGLSGTALFSTSNMHGYTSALDVVLDERRMELAFEGFRVHDLCRNKRNMDRRFGGVQPWEIVRYDDSRWQYPIPYNETSVSGIK